MPEAYDERYAKWNFEDLPIILIYQGSPGGLLENPESLTGRCIKEYIAQNK